MFPEIATKLMVESLECAKTEDDGETLFNALAHTKTIVQGTKTDGSSSALGYGACLKKEWSRIDSETRPALLKADYAATLLSRIQVEDEKRLLAALRSAAQAIDLENTADIELLCGCVARNEAIRAEARSEFATLLLLRLVKEDLCGWSEMSELTADQEAKVEVLIQLVDETDPDQSEALIAHVVQEAQLLDPGEQASAFRRIADNWLNRDPLTCTSLYVQALESSSLHVNAAILMTIAQHLVEICIRHKGLGTKQLSEKLCLISERDLFDSDQNVMFNDWNAFCRMAAALIQWSCESEGLEDLCKEAWTGEVSTLSTYWDLLTCRTYVAVYENHGPSTAEKFLSTLLKTLPEEASRDLAEKAVSLALVYRSAGRPLACYQVWRYAPESQYVPLVRSLLPRCGNSTAAIAHLSLAMCGGQDGSPVDVQELEKTWVLSQDEAPDHDLRFKRDLLTLYSIVHGVKGAIQSLLQLLPDTRRRNMNLSGITLAAINSSSAPSQLLREIWSRTEMLYGVGE